jgi:nicotinamide phosphoribosyltransferase
MHSILSATDFYKTGHHKMYPAKTEKIYSNLTPRSSRMKGVDHAVVFGIQYFVKKYLIKEYNDNFFSQLKEEVVAKYRRRMDNALGKGVVTTEHLEALHDLGYLPLEVKALMVAKGKRYD